ncbi:GntR family transcriptional regulator [Paenibacillus sp. NPDC058174]|uniref:GntR family transcriptional regulator n=1 Tax=Paenibacillus sp. NPDC058174 TaxID=3346366 RepID=UPI0036D8008E
MANKQVPMYREIEQYIMTQIRCNKWPPLSRIPSENELSEQFQVSRITVKNALSNLVDNGIVFRQQGKGTFVSADHHMALDNLYSKMGGESRKRTIGFLMPRLDNHFTANVLSGIEDELSKADYRMLFSKTNDSQQDEIVKIKDMMEAQVDGLIIYPVEGENYNSEILSLTLSKFPLVLVDRTLKGLDTSSVSSDNFEASIMAVNHLHEHGHTSIGIISSRADGTSSIEDRIAGYEQGLENHGILIDRSLQLSNLTFDMTEEEISSQVHKFLNDHPQLSAIIVSYFGPHVIRAAIEAGRRVPEDLSVILFDDIPYADFSLVPPTVVAQQEREIGREAARHIIEQIEQGQHIWRRIKLPATLIPRGSTGPARSRSELDYGQTLQTN